MLGPKRPQMPFSPAHRESGRPAAHAPFLSDPDPTEQRPRNQDHPKSKNSQLPRANNASLSFRGQTAWSSMRSSSCSNKKCRLVLREKLRLHLCPTLSPTERAVPPGVSGRHHMWHVDCVARGLLSHGVSCPVDDVDSCKSRREHSSGVDVYGVCIDGLESGTDASWATWAGPSLFLCLHFHRPIGTHEVPRDAALTAGDGQLLADPRSRKREKDNGVPHIHLQRAGWGDRRVLRMPWLTTAPV